ncbi:MAG: hypothetical protein WCX81_06965 [Monoglobales bacterium]
MKKISKKTIIIIVAALLVIAVSALTLAAIFSEGDFRRAKWGMNVDKVISRESGTVVNQSEFALTIRDEKILDVPVKTHIFYKFDGPKGLYQVTMGYNLTGYEDKLADRIITAFEKKYGETDYKKTLTSYEYTWVTDRTKIFISQQQSYLFISFTDIKYAKSAESEE